MQTRFFRLPVTLVCLICFGIWIAFPNVITKSRTLSQTGLRKPDTKKLIITMTQKLNALDSQPMTWELSSQSLTGKSYGRIPYPPFWLPYFGLTILQSSSWVPSKLGWYEPPGIVETRKLQQQEGGVIRWYPLYSKFGLAGLSCYMVQLSGDTTA